MGKHVYYLASLDISYLEIDDLYDEFENYQNLTLEDLEKIDFQYIADLEEDGASIYSEDINHESVLKFKKLSKLIDVFISCFYGSDKEILDDPFLRLVDNFVIIKKHTKTNLYSITDTSDILNCFNLVFDNLDDDSDFEPIEIKNFDSTFEEITNKLDSLMLGEYDQICSAADPNKAFIFSAIKKGSKLYKELKKDKEIVMPKENHNNIIYECGYDTYKDFIKNSLITAGKISTLLSCKVPNQNMYKKYGFFVYIDNEDKLSYLQFDAQQVQECFDVTDKSDIYCGIKEDDIICGFDLI